MLSGQPIVSAMPTVDDRLLPGLEQRFHPGPQIQILVAQDSKFDIKKEILDDEQQQQLRRGEVAAEVNDVDAATTTTTTSPLASNVADAAIEKESCRRKSLISENFDQFWSIVGPKVVSNLSLWDFLSDKTRFADTSSSTAKTSAISRRKDVAKLDFLLSEVECLIEQVSGLIRTCCLAADCAASDVTCDDDDVTSCDDSDFVELTASLSKLLPDCDARNVRKVRLKRREEIPEKFRELIFEAVPASEVDHLDEVIVL